MSDKIIIRKADLLTLGRAGHPQAFCGTGTHRDHKRNPKGGKKRQAQRAIREWS